jgi:hypothetical protein
MKPDIFRPLWNDQKAFSRRRVRPLGFHRGHALDMRLDALAHLLELQSRRDGDIDAVDREAAREADLGGVDEHHHHLPAEGCRRAGVVEQPLHVEVGHAARGHQRDPVVQLEPAVLGQTLRDQDRGRVVGERERIVDHAPLALLRERQEEGVAQEVHAEHQQRPALAVGAARRHLQHRGGVLHALEVRDLPGQRAGNARVAARDGEIRLARHAVDHVFEGRDQTVVGGQHRAQHTNAEGDAQDDESGA